MTTSSLRIFRLGMIYFCLCCRLSKYSFFQQAQNSFTRCCTRVQRFLQYLSGDWKVPGGGRTTLVFMVRRWFGVKGFKDDGSVMVSTVSRRLLTITFASHIKVLRDSPFNCEPLLWRSALRTLRTKWICRSQTTPIWLAEGIFILNINQSQSQSLSAPRSFSAALAYFPSY